MIFLSFMTSWELAAINFLKILLFSITHFTVRYKLRLRSAVCQDRRMWKNCLRPSWAYAMFLFVDCLWFREEHSCGDVLRMLPHYYKNSCFGKSGALPAPTFFVYISMMVKLKFFFIESTSWYAISHHNYFKALLDVQQKCSLTSVFKALVNGPSLQ